MVFQSCSETWEELRMKYGRSDGMGTERFHAIDFAVSGKVTVGIE